MKYHPLTKLIDKTMGLQFNEKAKPYINEIICRWLEEKAEEIAQNIYDRHLEGGGKIVIHEKKEIKWQRKLLELTDSDILELSVKEKLLSERDTDKCVKDIIQIAKEYYIENRDELDE